jgi:hypothetical protein
MIVVRLMGGLGNQLFQYAAGRSVAKLRDADLAVDLGWFRRRMRATDPVRLFDLASFRLDIKILSLSERQIAALEAPTRILYQPVRWLTPKFRVVREESQRFDAAVLRTSDDSLLIGYWQSERYFESVRNEIRGDLTSGQRLGPKIDQHIQILRSVPTLGVHVRRGDYVTNPSAAAFHGTLGRDYYQAAVRHVMEGAAVEQVIVFSDDPTWAEEQLKFPVPTQHLSAEFRDTFDEFHLLRSCHHQVIANSSFSWWAAWLNDNPGKIVVAPTHWYRDSTVDTSDLIPSSWHRL